MAETSGWRRDGAVGALGRGRGKALGTLAALAILIAATPGAATAAATSPVGAIRSSAVSTNGLNRVTLGPDNKLWFTECGTSSRIGRIDPSEVGQPNPVVEHFPTTTDSCPIDITTGPDGALWFTEFAGNIGRITTDGQLNEFPVPGAPHLFGITRGPDQNLWFVANCCGDANGMIGRITTAGHSTLFPVARGTSPAPGITTGPDGNLWYPATNIPRQVRGRTVVDRIRGSVQRMTPAGRVSGHFPIPTRYSDPSRIVTGPDGNLWFTEQGAVGASGCCQPTHPAPGKIGRITTSGRITEFTTPTPLSNPAGITAGPDGNLWFTEYGYEVRHMPGILHGGNKVGRITPSGRITEFSIPTPYARADGVTSGPDDAVYFTESPGNNAFGAIGRVQS